MLDDESTQTPDVTPEPGRPEDGADGTPAAGTPATEPATEAATDGGVPEAPAGERPVRRTAKKAAAKKTPAKKAGAKKAPAKKAATRKTAAKKAAAPAPTDGEDTGQSTTPPDAAAAGGPTTQAEQDVSGEAPATAEETTGRPATEDSTAGPAAPAIPLFQPPDPTKAVVRKRSRKKAEAPAETPSGDETTVAAGAGEVAETIPGEAQDTDETAGLGEEGEGGTRRRRRRGGRRRRKSGDGGDDESSDAQPAETGDDKAAAKDTSADKPEDDEETASGTRRRRRRRRRGEDDGGAPDDPDNTVVRVRERRQASDDEISGFTGSTRLEAKKQRRREGREAGRRRAPIVSEAEFLARREAVDRVMVVRQSKDVTQIGVLEDGVLVEHYVARESQTSLIGNVYLGRVQNVLPSMEAAFIDIGKGRNAVLYAGEVNWDLLGKDGQPRRIESALKSGQTVLVQVTKDPVGHKGARLTSQVSLPGRYLVYMPGGQSSGISRKLPDTERNRLKNLLKEILPDESGVIIRTAAEGASEEELRRDVTRLTARWDDIRSKVDGGQAPQLLYGEPDLMIKVIRDLFTEDFKKLVVSGDDAWDMIEGYVSHVAPDLMERVERWNGDGDVFGSYRVDEQIAKALERKVWLPSGGSLVIDRTEAMTVVDVNTGKFTGSGGNLEETVTKNNLEAAEEMVRQLRLRDIGGIIVIDFIDMVLESNRDLVLRRLIECLGRDRTRHQVAEVTSLGLVQMTRKRIGTGLFEAFSETCEHCNGRGYHIHAEPVEPSRSKDDDSRRGRRRRGDSGEKQSGKQDDKPSGKDGGKSSGKDDGKPSGKQDGGKPSDKQDGGKPSDKQDGGKPSDKQDGGKPSDKQDGGKQAKRSDTRQSDGQSDRQSDRQAGKRSQHRRSEDKPADTSEPGGSSGPDSEDAGPGTGPQPERDRAPEPQPASAAAPDAPDSGGSSDGVGPQADSRPAAPQEPAQPVQPAPARRPRRRAATRPAGPPQ